MIVYVFVLVLGQVDWKAFADYSVTGIPAASLGARTLLALLWSAVS